MATIVKEIRIKARIYPTPMQDVPAGKEEVAAIRSFIAAIEAAVAKHLPYAGHEIKIREKRGSDIRGGR